MSYKIPLFDLNYGADEIQALTDTIKDNWISIGPRCEKFEADFAAALHSPYALTVDNCTNALFMALMALDIGPGDEVLVPSLTFVATVNSVKYVGATPVFCDITSYENLCISPQEIEAKITPRTKAITVMHYAGFPCDMDAIMAIARKHNLKVIEDACHGPLSEYRGGQLSSTPVKQLSSDQLSSTPVKQLSSDQLSSTPVKQLSSDQLSSTPVKQLSSDQLSNALNTEHCALDTEHCTLNTEHFPKLGTIGDIGCFSFFSNKNISTGEGGMLTCKDEAIYKRLKLLRSHGMTTTSYQRAGGHSTKYDVVSLGYNFRMDDLRAALGIAQLGKLKADLLKRAQVRSWYDDMLVGLPHIVVPFSSLNVGRSMLDVRRSSPLYSNYIFPIMLTCGDADYRDGVRDRLHAAGVQTSVHYPAAHRFSIYQSLNAKLPLTEYASDHLITLPMYSKLTQEDVAFVVTALRDALQPFSSTN
jgi:dTDP-4-amino-4,6-dideoxygalactose transaminase